jgi:hypothetical protein
MDNDAATALTLSYGFMYCKMKKLIHLDAAPVPAKIMMRLLEAPASVPQHFCRVEEIR